MRTSTRVEMEHAFTAKRMLIHTRGCEEGAFTSVERCFSIIPLPDELLRRSHDVVRCLLAFSHGVTGHHIQRVQLIQQCVVERHQSVVCRTEHGASNFMRRLPRHPVGAYTGPLFGYTSNTVCGIR